MAPQAQKDFYILKEVNGIGCGHTVQVQHPALMQNMLNIFSAGEKIRLVFGHALHGL